MGAHNTVAVLLFSNLYVNASTKMVFHLVVIPNFGKVCLKSFFWLSFFAQDIEEEITTPLVYWLQEVFETRVCSYRTRDDMWQVGMAANNILCIASAIS